MSAAVSASGSSNPYAYLQALWQQEQSSGATPQSDPLSQLLAAISQQGGGATSSPGAGSSTGATSTSGNALGQFSPQTLQALLALQSSGNGSSQQSPFSQFNADGSAGMDDTTSGQQAHHGHHHRHHHMDNDGGLGGQSPLDLLNSAEAGATSQTTANANGSTTTAITFADGSSVSMTTAAATGSSASSGASSGGANVANNNFIEQLIQLQAQLVNAAPAQGIATV